VYPSYIADVNAAVTARAHASVDDVPVAGLRGLNPRRVESWKRKVESWKAETAKAESTRFDEPLHRSNV